jgi:enoyl-CoA hydratase/carnithine racemase
MKSKYGDVSVALDGHVAVVEIDRPPNNHVSVDLMGDLADALVDLDAEAACRTIVLASAGKVFCGGADLTAPTGIGGAGMEGINPLYVEAVRLFSNKKPIVAAIQGAAVGAGLGLALVADFRVAAPEARFAANFVKLGFHPGFGLSHTLPRLIGLQRAALMMQTGRRLRGDEALEWGLADEIAPLDELRNAAIRLAREIAENAPLAVQSTRATLRGDLAQAVKAMTDHEFVEQSWLRKTADYKEGVRAERLERDGLDLSNASAEVRAVRHRSADGLAKAARGMLTQRDAGVMNSLATIAAPAVVIVGANDTPFLAASDYMAAKIPGATKVVIPDAGHAANIDQPEAFNRAVVEFLDGLA